jgi:16S rRNA (adenine1518-N6/adenine1519-N6)-dimethyltransferase
MPCPSLESKRSLESWTREALRLLGLRPRRELGQNFLVDPRIIKYYERFTPSGEDIIEIGTGLGTLTCSLARRAARLLTIEIDHRLASYAASVTRSLGNVVQLVGDGVKLILSSKARILASNLAYSIASQVIVNMIKNNIINYALVMIQEDVARRIIAEPGSSEYGRITVVVRRYFDTQILGVFPPSSFYPRPEVRSALVALKRKRHWSPEDEGLLDIIRCLFSHRNKLLRRALSICGYDSVGLEELMGKRDKRVRDLNPEEAFQLASLLRRGGRA